MALDLLARGLAASARNLAATAGEGALPTLAQLAQLSSRTIPAAVVRIEAGVGAARGAYVADALATAALALAHPLFCKADAGGRHFRLLPDDAGLIPVACGGALGFDAEPLTGTALTDERAILNAAELYRHAIGAAGVRLDARRYAVRRTTLPGGTDYAASINFVPFNILSSSKWVSTHPEGTTIYRRKANGQQCDLADFESTTGFVARFRGGLFLIAGTDPASGDPGPDKHSFTLDNIMLDGGLRLSMGLIFEILDKPVWQFNDKYVGNLTFRGRSGAIGFASELVYTSAATPESAALRFLTIDDTCVFGETGGSCLNPNGITTQVGRCLLYNALIGVEGWTGDRGYIHATFRNCAGSSIQGGVVKPTPANYYEPNRAVTARLPMGQIDVRLENCPRFDVGSWIEGDILAIDSLIAIGNADVFNVFGAEGVNLRVRSFVDKTSLNSAVRFLGHAAGTLGVRNLHVRIDCHRTLNAVTNSLRHVSAVGTQGSLGPNVSLEYGVLDGVGEPVGYAAAGFDNQPMVRGLSGHRAFALTFGNTVNIQTGAGGTLPNLPVIFLSSGGTATGQYTMNLPAAGVQDGSEIIIDNYTRLNVNPGVALRIPAASLVSGKALIVPSDYFYCRVRYQAANAKWQLVEAPPAARATAAFDPASLALNASTAIQTVTVNGAAVGDDVRATFSLDLAGARITAWVSAVNTVSYYFTNNAGTNPLNLASGTVTLEVSP